LGVEIAAHSDYLFKLNCPSSKLLTYLLTIFLQLCVQDGTMGFNQENEMESIEAGEVWDNPVLG